MNNKQVEKENYYDILQNADQEIMICLKAREYSPQSPQMLYAGQDKILFYRRENETVLLDSIHQDVWKSLENATQVYVAEYSATDTQTQEKGIIREYTVALRHVQKLPESA